MQAAETDRLRLLLLRIPVCRNGEKGVYAVYFKTRVTLRNDGNFEGHGFGRGVDQLLTGVETYGSLNRAAKEIGMAYSKSWRVLRQAEEEFGITLLDRNGAHGSTLTEEGRTFLMHYREMLAAAEKAAGEVFAKYFA